MVEKKLYAKWSRFRMPFKYGKAQLFEYRTGGRKFELKKVWYLNVSGNQMIGIQIPTVCCINTTLSRHASVKFFLARKIING